MIRDRVVKYGDGFNPLGRRTDEEMADLRASLAAAGRDPDALELIGGTRATFTGPDSVADLQQALETIPAQWEQGYRTFCIKPSQFTDDPDGVGDFCRDVMKRAERLV